ncbi:MAG: hypothetical protein ACYTGV_06560 [Planctomycetota bacterium]|jgi:hypothetical protein
MRAIGTLFILTLTVAAQESAAELFYKGFWLENAAGKPRQAIAFYEQVVKDYPDDPVTPRAVLGLVRLKTARGEDVSELLKLLGGAELEAAKRIVAARQGAFDSSPSPGDSPVQRKIKQLFKSLVANQSLHPTDRSFLVDAGAAAHPMLRAVLRTGTSYQPISYVAQVLLEQQSEPAAQILAEALRDDDVLFHSAIIAAIGPRKTDSVTLLKAVVDSYDGDVLSIKHQGAIVQAMRRQARFEGPGRNICYALLIRALENPDDGIRAEACRPSFERYEDIPTAYLGKMLDRMASGDQFVRDAGIRILMNCANRAEIFEGAKVVYEKAPLRTLTTMGEPPHEEAALLLAHAAIAQRSVNPGGSLDAVRIAAAKSPRAAILLLETGLKNDDRQMVHYTSNGVESIPESEAERLRLVALTAWYAGDAAAAGTAIELLGLSEKHFDPLLAAARAHPGAGLPKWVAGKPGFKAFGASKAAQLAPYCKDRAQLRIYLEQSVDSLRDGPGSNAFLRAVVPDLGPDAMNLLPKVAKVSETGAILAVEKLLKEDGDDWKWGRSENARPRGGVAAAYWGDYRIQKACNLEVLRPKLLAATADPRYAVGWTAVLLAEKIQGDEGLEALTLALSSPFGKVRHRALNALIHHKPGGADAVIAAWDTLSPQERYAGQATIRYAGEARHAPFARKILEKRDGQTAVVWHTYFELAPKEAVDYALGEVFVVGDLKHRKEALAVLTRTQDARRLGTFRKILQGSEEWNWAIDMVVNTIADQYLIELGPQVLEQLRNPDPKVREAATKAIEKLKFYAEAKRLLGG